MSPTRTTAKLDEAPVAMLNVDAVTGWKGPKCCILLVTRAGFEPTTL